MSIPKGDSIVAAELLTYLQLLFLPQKNGVRSRSFGKHRTLLSRTIFQQFDCHSYQTLADVLQSFVETMRIVKSPGIEGEGCGLRS